MAKRIGLRTEIIVHIILLMAAALLFVSFLLLKFGERELLQERVGRVEAAVQLLARTIEPELMPESAALSGEIFPEDLDLISYTLVGRDLQPIARQEGDPLASLNRAMLRQARQWREDSLLLFYDGAWWPFDSPSERTVLVTVPVLDSGRFAGALQCRFSLQDIRDRILGVQKIVFLLVAAYGLVLVLFGSYLLGRIVVRPIGRLAAATREVAAGNLQQRLEEGGTTEIADLASHFNAMVEALKESRELAEQRIVSLRRANEETRRAQDELVRSERMASVGHLAAGMAHEIGNPLGAVVGYLELLKMELADGHQQDLAERSLVEVRRIDRLVRDLLDYAAPEGGQAENVDPCELLREAHLLLCQQGALDTVVVEDRLPATLGTIAASRHKLLQVFVNLLLNARDASSDGQKIVLSGQQEAGGLWLAVADEGSGMSPEVAEHIFDPFYTTKPPGKGRGLGLSVCHRIVEEASGRIEVQSQPGHGSRFILHFRQGSGEDA